MTLASSAICSLLAGGGSSFAAGGSAPARPDGSPFRGPLASWLTARARDVSCIVQSHLDVVILPLAAWSAIASVLFRVRR